MCARHIPHTYLHAFICLIMFIKVVSTKSSFLKIWSEIKRDKGWIQSIVFSIKHVICVQTNANPLIMFINVKGSLNVEDFPWMLMRNDSSISTSCLQ